MSTATFYVIHAPSRIKCVHTSVGLEDIYRLIGPGCKEIEFVSLPDLFDGMHAYVDGMGIFGNLLPNATLDAYLGVKLHGTILIGRIDPDGEDIGVSPMDVHMLDKLTGRI
jgi:hypothetical protein